jgi:hypothetical protein
MNTFQCPYCRYNFKKDISKYFKTIINKNINLLETQRIEEERLYLLQQYNRNIIMNSIYNIINQNFEDEDEDEYSQDENEYSQDENEYSQDENEYSQDENEYSQDENEYSQDENNENNQLERRLYTTSFYIYLVNDNENNENNENNN